ncbi:MAG: RecX family transcriptional regulator [Chloroflexi bacterium]|nr:RecX family transcriptional regulator [Chloroflexota bacterium]
MGGTITAIEVQKRNTERVNIYLDGQFAFAMEMIAASHLRKGQVLSVEEVEKLRGEDNVAKAYDRAIRYLASRPRSAQEVRRKLQTADFNPEVIEAVIDRLEDMNYLDDLAFAQMWVRDRSQFNPRGPMALRAELRTKGITDTTIDVALTDLDVIPLAMAAAEQKSRSLRAADQHSFRRKLSSYLARRGFDFETISTVVDSLIESMDIEDSNEE